MPRGVWGVTGSNIWCACGHALSWHYQATEKDATRACFGRIIEGQKEPERCGCPNFIDSKDAALQEGLYTARQYFAGHTEAKVEPAK